MSLSSLLDFLHHLPPTGTLTVEWILAELGDASEPAATAADGDLRCEDVAELYDRTPASVRTWCREGRIPGAYRVRGREWRIPRASLARFRELEAQGQQQSRPPSPGGPSEPVDLSSWRRIAEGKNQSRST